MSRRLFGSVFLFLSLALVCQAATEKLSYDKYHTPDEVAALLKSWMSAYPQLTKLINIGKSPGNGDLVVFRIAAQAKGIPEPDKRPAIFVSANIEGVHPVGTEAALMLIENLLTQYGKDKKTTPLLEKRTVYVAPLLNPDVAQHFFAQTRWENLTNNQPVDDDLDDMIDEDGPDDLNKDGLITQMRIKDPEGNWIPDPSEPRLMKQAEPKKGEKGIYKIYSEGLDNDGDGDYNEDPAGGVELNRNFPHDFEYYLKPAGLWPVSQKETIALMEFLSSQSNIALVLNFSSENTFLNLQQTGRAAAAGEKIKVPQRFASFLGLDPDKEYDIQELVTLLKGMGIFVGREIDESLIAMLFGLGPAMAIDRQDMPYIEAVQKDYKDGLKKAGMDYLEKRAKGVGKGSFAAYCYYQLGVPVFSSDLWAIPEPKKEPEKEEKDALTVERLKTMTSEEFLALGDEKIEDFLKEQGAPPSFKASMLKQMVKSGKVTPQRMVEMMEKMPKRPAVKEGEHPDSYLLNYSDTVLKGKGFVDWKPYKHPTLGEVEIGGFVPFLRTTPPPSEIEKTIAFHTDFYMDLMNRLPQLEVKETKVKALDDGLYQVTVYLTNPGWFPTSTAQGRRAGTSWPIRIELKMTKDQSIFSGRAVESISFIEGSGDTKNVEWTIRGKKGSKVTIVASSPKLDTATATVVLQ